VTRAVTLSDLEMVSDRAREEILHVHPQLAEELSALGVVAHIPARTRAPTRPAAAPVFATMTVAPGQHWRLPPVRWVIQVYVKLWERYPRQRATLHLWRTRLRPIARFLRRLVG
jgi:hypothetical protein